MSLHRSRRAPRGFTLIEISVAVTLGAVVMGTATALLFAVVRSNETAHERLEQIAVRGRLADRFRGDVDAAKTCRLWDEKQPAAGILLAADDGHGVRYAAGEHAVTRTVMTGDQAGPRETFYLGERDRAALTFSADPAPVVRCTIDREPEGTEPGTPAAGTPPRAALGIAAVLGRGERLAERVRQAAQPASTEPHAAAPPAAETPPAETPPAETPPTETPPTEPPPTEPPTAEAPKP